MPTVSQHISFYHGMGVRRLFSRGGQNFPGGGKNILFALKTPKNILFSSKKSQNILFWPARGGQGPPLALPCGRPWFFHRYWFFKQKAIYERANGSEPGLPFGLFETVCRK